MMVAAYNFRETLFQILKMSYSDLLQEERNHNSDGLNPIDRADSEVDTGSLGEVARLDRDLGDRESETNGLRDNLRVENKIVGIQQKRHGCE